MERSLAGKNQINYFKSCITLRRRPLLISSWISDEGIHIHKQPHSPSSQIKRLGVFVKRLELYMERL